MDELHGFEISRNLSLVKCDMATFTLLLLKRRNYFWKKGEIREQKWKRERTKKPEENLWPKLSPVRVLILSLAHSTLKV